jgi:hypothetical protein
MKRAIAVVVGTILVGLMLTGCATTQSAQPGVTFNTTDRAKIKSAIINDFKNLEFKVVSETGDVLILEGRRLGYTGRDTMHAILRMVTTDGSTTVAAQAYLKSEGSFGRNQYTDEITYSVTGTELLKILQRVKVQVESE